MIPASIGVSARRFLTDSADILKQSHNTDKYGTPQDDYEELYLGVPCRLIRERGARTGQEGAMLIGNTNTRIDRYVLAVPASQEIPKDCLVRLNGIEYLVDEANVNLTDAVFNRVSLVRK